ncbi:hypothetical protein BVRB_031000, partial [Beta vulgaris subsp. vulgaris]
MIEVLDDVCCICWKPIISCKPFTVQDVESEIKANRVLL